MGIQRPHKLFSLLFLPLGLRSEGELEGRVFVSVFLLLRY